MSLKFKILSSVIFIFTISFCFNSLFNYVELRKTVKNHQTHENSQISKLDKLWVSLLRVFLSDKIADIAEKMEYTFNTIDSNIYWKTAFLPNEYMIKTNNWGTASTLLVTFPWIDLVNVNINNKNNAYIYLSSPYLQKYIKIKAKDNIFLFITKIDDNFYDCFIGVPFYTDPNNTNFIKEIGAPSAHIIPNESEWLLYDLDALINLPLDSYKVRDSYVFIDGVPTKKSKLTKKHLKVRKKNNIFERMLDPIKNNIKIIKQSLKNSPKLIKTLQNEKTKQIYLKNLTKDIDIKPVNKSKKCEGPVCQYQTTEKNSQWFASDDFLHKTSLQKLIWQYFMISRTGAWNFDPFSKYAPIGFATTETKGEYNIENVAEGSMIKNFTAKKPIKTKPDCVFKTKSPDFDKYSIFKNKESGKITSCNLTHLELHFNKKIEAPFITSTKFIRLQETPSSPWNTTSLTIGISLDNFFQEFALLSGDLLIITKDKNYKYYYDDRKLKSIFHLSTEHKKKIITHNKGTIQQEDGGFSYFTRIGNITENDGHIILIEEGERSRSEEIAMFSKQLQTNLKKLTLNNIFSAIASIIIVCLVLLKIISKITRPINELAKATEKIGNMELDKIELPQNKLSSDDEIGKLYSSFAEMIHSMQEGEKVRGLLDKVVSKEIAAKIIKEGVNLSGEIKHISILFCDIRGFTSITEKMDPKDVLTMLNECLTILSNSIDSFDGVIDNFEGDCIMALFGAPIDTTDHAKKAVDCALDMQKNLSIWNKNRDDNNLQRLDIGIGIHTGDAVAGNVGTQNHLSYSVLGHMVNLSSRICDVAKPQQILISKETLDEYPDIITQEQPPQEFKGISEPIITFAVMKKK